MKAIDTKEKDSKLSLLSIFGVGVFLFFISMSLYLAYLYYNSPSPSSINKNDTINLTLIAEPVLASTGDIVSLQDARCKYYGKLVNAKDEFGGARGLYFQVNDKGVRLEFGNYPTLSFSSLTGDFVPLIGNP